MNPLASQLRAGYRGIGSDNKRTSQTSLEVPWTPPEDDPLLGKFDTLWSLTKGPSEFPSKQLLIANDSVSNVVVWGFSMLLRRQGFLKQLSHVRTPFPGGERGSTSSSGGAADAEREREREREREGGGRERERERERERAIERERERESDREREREREWYIYIYTHRQRYTQIDRYR